MGAVEILRDALRTAGAADAVVLSEQAFELALDPPARGLVIGVSHEGGTSATNARAPCCPRGRRADRAS